MAGSQVESSMNTPLTELITKSTKILIVSHTTPDYDAYSSLLYMYATLKENFPEKNLLMSLDTGEPNPIMSTLPYFNEINTNSFLENLQTFQPELIIMVDSPSFERVSRRDQIEAVKEQVKGKPVAIFDHHPVEYTDVDLLVNEDAYATVDILHNYFETNSLKLPRKWEEYYLTGFIGDTSRFYFECTVYQRAFVTVSKILDHGYRIRDFSDRLYGYTEKDLLIYKVLLRNIKNEGQYLLTYMSQEEYSKEIKPTISESEYKKGRRFFIDEFMNKTQGFDFVVSIVPDDTAKDGITYSGSIRSKEYVIDCTLIANALHGGGHHTGSGFTIQASSIEEAIDIFKRSLALTEEKARSAAKELQLSQQNGT